MIILGYDKGSLTAHGGFIPHGKRNSGQDTYRAPAFRYREILRYLDENNYDLLQEIMDTGELSDDAKVGLKKVTDEYLKVFGN